MVIKGGASRRTSGADSTFNGSFPPLALRRTCNELIGGSVSDLKIVNGDLEAFAGALEEASEDLAGLSFDSGGAITASMPGTTCSSEFETAAEAVRAAQTTATDALDSIVENARLAARDYAVNEAAAEASLRASAGVLDAVE